MLLTPPQHLDSLNPADAPVPRHEYHSDGEDADADALHSGTQDSRARLIAADVRIEWGSSSASPTLPLPAHSPVLIIADSLVRAFEHAHDPARCRARGRLLGRDHGQIYARLGVLDQGGLVVCLERRVRVAEAHPLAEGLLARLEELVGTGSEWVPVAARCPALGTGLPKLIVYDPGAASRIIILDTYLPQTYVVLDTAPPAWTTPPVRYLRAGHTRSLARELESDAGSGASGSKARGMETGTTTLEPLQSPNYVSGFSAALLGAVRPISAFCVLRCAVAKSTTLRSRSHAPAPPPPPSHQQLHPPDPQPSSSSLSLHTPPAQRARSPSSQPHRPAPPSSEGQWAISRGRAMSDGPSGMRGRAGRGRASGEAPRRRWQRLGRGACTSSRGAIPTAGCSPGMIAAP